MHAVYNFTSPAKREYTLQKQVGGFNHKVVTLHGWRRTGETVIMNCIRQTQGAAAHFILQPQYTENPYNIASLTWLQVPYCNFEVHL